MGIGFDGFEPVTVEREGVAIRAWAGGSGSPLLLLHGYPQTHVMWHRIADDLARDHRVVLADLRGYGDSAKPADDPDHLTYSKREMAADQAHLMTALGFDEFAVVGHDRGGRVGHRLALDFADRVTSLVVMDIVPTLHMFDHVDRGMAESYFHWFFLTRPDDLPERLIAADPVTWLSSRFEGRNAGGLPIDPAAYDSYLSAFRGSIASSCADYRAAAGVDLLHDRQDREAGRRVEAPMLAMWGSESYVGRTFDVPAVWSEYVVNLRAAPVHADHYLAEENPESTIRALREFWNESWTCR